MCGVVIYVKIQSMLMVEFMFIQKHQLIINKNMIVMYGMVVEIPKEGPTAIVDAGRLGFLAAYSGLLSGRNDWPYFVPPVFDAQQPDGYFKTQEREISRISRDSRESRLSRDSSDSNSKQLSQELQTWLFPFPPIPTNEWSWGGEGPR